MRLTVAALMAFSLAPAARGDDRSTGPWDVPSLKAAPPVVWLDDQPGPLRRLEFDSVPLDGKPTRVFAYYARPRDGKGPFPAMVLLHGGGGTAFKEWAQLWADRGYAALAPDLSGRGDDGKRLSCGGPEQSDEEKFRDFAPGEADRMWTYHAVAAAIKGHSLLAAMPEVDKDRVGVTGISWGGYLTCIVAGVDDRVKVAAPVYGCGFLDEDSCWLGRFQAMGPARTRRWADLFDPSRYLSGVSCPILFVNGTNDFAYPLGSYRKSYRLVTKAPVDLRVTVKMPHGHSEGWAPKEIGLFADSILGGGTPLPRLGATSDVGGRLESRVVASPRPIRAARLHISNDAGPWPAREWSTTDARVEGDLVVAPRPEGRPLVAFFTVEDDRGAVVSSPHLAIE